MSRPHRPLFSRRKSSRCRSIGFEALEPRNLLATFTVVNTGDSGPGSLRQAILDTNAATGADVIQFDPGVTGTISLTSGELAITGDVDLQGPGASVVTVSGNNASRVFYVTADVTISGLSIANGSTGEGGGIYNNGTLTVDSCAFSGHFASIRGGGISNWHTLTVRNTTFTGNTAYSGGGIDSPGILTVEDSTFTGNTASQTGGGINNWFNGVLTVTNTSISGSSAGWAGSGIYNLATATIRGSTVHDNTFDGIFNHGGTMTVEGSTLYGNTNSGIANGSILTVLNSTITGNNTGINNFGGNLTVQSSTITRNSGTVGISNLATATLHNTIVAANFRNLHGVITPKDIDGSVASSSSHNLIGVDTNLSGISHGASGNQIGTEAAPINPLLGALQDNGGPTHTTALLPGSPGINAGDNSQIPVGVTTDQRGSARIDSGIVDIGAYEYVIDNSPATFIVTNLNDSGPGSLRQAVTSANANVGPDIVQFASGLTGTITLTSGELAIYEASLDIQGPGASVITVSGNNTSRVFSITASATITGLTIANGNASLGGAISNTYGTLNVANSVLRDNSAASGGAIYNAHGALTVDNTALSGNTATQSGGGIYNTANYGTLSVVLNSTLGGNSAQDGGGIFNSGSMSVSESAFTNNSANTGGGIANGGVLNVDSSSLSNNSVDSRGGGIANWNRLTIQNSIFSANLGHQGGGIYSVDRLTVEDSLFTGNSSFGGDNGGGAGIFSGGTTTVANTTFSDNSAANVGGGINVSSGTLDVVNSTFDGNSAGSGGGIVNGGALTISSSTLSGNSAAYGGGISNRNTLTVQNSTLTGNSSVHGGGGIENLSVLTMLCSTLSGNLGGGISSFGASTLHNTIVTANSFYDFNGAVASSSSHNLIGVDTNLSGISHGANGNQVGTAATPINPLLGPLQDNGGLTLTMALLAGSAAINAGDNSHIPPGTTTDQRGPGYARVSGANVDIGAFEYLVVRSVTIDIHPESLNLDSNGTLTVVIYGAADFSAAQIDVSTVQFAGAAAWQSALVDANNDGRLDMQLKFRRQDTALLQLYEQLLTEDHDGDGVLDTTRQVAEVAVTGETLDDHLFSGTDSVTLFLAGRSLRELLNRLFG